jgi:DNA invertase Pin-like site-specific DNA recombinase
MKADKPIAAYLRISSKDQNSEGQREAVQGWLEANGTDMSKVEFYVDVESGPHSIGYRLISSLAR